MENNWIDLFGTCIILFIFILMFVAGAVFVQQVNIWRNERNMHKRLDMRYKREMESKVEFTKIDITPIVLRYESNYEQIFLDKCLEDKFYKDRLLRSIVEAHMANAILENMNWALSETIYGRTGRQSRVLKASIAIIPKEHLHLFK